MPEWNCSRSSARRRPLDCFHTSRSRFGRQRGSCVDTRPRLLLTAAEKSRLLAKVNANDVSWQALKARADTLATY
jgi:hypothetical protein